MVKDKSTMSLKIQVKETAKAVREKAVNNLKKTDKTKVKDTDVFELLVRTNERIEEIYDMLKLMAD